MPPPPPLPLVDIEGLEKRFGAVTALDGITAAIHPGRMTGLVGPDGAGKTTLLRLVAGLLRADGGRLSVCGADPGTDPERVHEAVGYMPQSFGLYEDLSVAENLSLYADLRGVVGDARERAFDRLLRFTGLGPFRTRLAGRLSGGMKQKLGIACAMVVKPRLLLLDEPSVGVDPVSRRELWAMVQDLVADDIGVVWSTAYLDEAERCDAVLLLDRGRLLHAGPPDALTRRMDGRTFILRAPPDKRVAQARAAATAGVLDALIQGPHVRLVMAQGAAPPDGAHPTPPRFEDAFVSLLDDDAAPHAPLATPTAPVADPGEGDVVTAQGLTRRFGDFTAVDDVSFAVARGEIFGLLGPNGAGKSTTFKMMCGLLPPTAGTARVAGIDLGHAASAGRAKIGYMSQKFSLYGDLSVGQNLAFFASVYGLKGQARKQAIRGALEGYGLDTYAKANARTLPLGFKQRLSLACATLHRPPILFLDEPTSGVDPLTRREFWGRINALAADGVTVLVTTHFLDEAEYCDRLGIVFRGRLVADGVPDALKARFRTADTPEPTLEDAFIALIEAEGREDAEAAA
ncbi:MAG: ABC transporter ATP-binding protein [Rhodobacterales bacterium]|nr:ABC transporter ATP-binding protein [Rhodobacterales bacterium]